MMKTLRFAALGAAVYLLAGCGGQGMISDRAYLRQMTEDFEIRREMLSRCGATAVVDDASLTRREREALQFLYAYMPLGDAVNYDGAYFLKNVRLSEQARAEMPWGRTIPDAIYRHFVLPVRANNENLDNAREVFYNELRDRVKGLSMTDAILEVNHWCHEKVIYAPTDARTSGPMALVSTAAGRCGEESVFLVTALRAVGIPARQVYTPRWAHTDDNHAWVEAWADGEWHFLGACEPEPVLDLGWFNGPASRGILLHTNVFGRYTGPEDVMQRGYLVTEINITSNYAPVSQVKVCVVDAESRPVPGARVEYKVYNYAELYTVAAQTADESGCTSLTAGRGDVVVWASHEGRFGWTKASIGRDESVTVVLDRKPGDALRAELYIVPPAENVQLPPVSDEQRAENTRRMALEDSIRNAHLATFATPEEGAAFARRHNLAPERTARLLAESKGNRAEIESFLAAAAEAGAGERALALLEAVTDKDLHDTPREVLDDHLYNALGDVRTVMNPRVGVELLTAYRAAFQELVDAETAEQYRRDPQLLVEWCRENLRMEGTHNLRSVPIRPLGVWASHLADSTSRDLFFVALCRSLEIPAWRDPVTGKVRYRVDGADHDVDFVAPEPVPTDYGTLRMTYAPTAAVPVPRYYNHFSLSRIEDGRMRLLNFDDRRAFGQLFGEGVRLEAGDYALVSGTRLGGGEVLAELCIFSIARDGATTVELRLPEERRTNELVGTFDTDAVYTDLAEGARHALHDAMQEGLCVVGVLGAGEEPTNHALHDIAAFREALEQLGCPLVLLFESEENAQRFKASDFPSLPANVLFGIDSTGEVRRRLAEGAALTRDELPIIAVSDSFGRIGYVSSGYSIGLGERIVKELTAGK